jgi:hypothetical protein
VIGARVFIESAYGILCGTVLREPRDGFIVLQDVINLTTFWLSPWRFPVPYLAINVRVAYQ